MDDLTFKSPILELKVKFMKLNYGHLVFNLKCFWILRKAFSFCIYEIVILLGEIVVIVCMKFIISILLKKLFRDFTFSGKVKIIFLS